MRDSPSKSPPDALARAIDSQATRKLRVQRRGDRSLWFGFGMFGLIGWSIAVPTFVGALGGVWLDRHYPGSHSWTLTFLVAGMVLGCAQAWHWVAQEDRKIRKEEENQDE